MFVVAKETSNSLLVIVTSFWETKNHLGMPQFPDTYIAFFLPPK